MTTQFNKNNLSAEINKVLPEIEKKQNGRPNIDHLIKKILIERRKRQKKNLFTSAAFLLIFATFIAISIYN
jgi:uncharacterized membrane protein